jgi:hypothetical protein
MGKDTCIRENRAEGADSGEDRGAGSDTHSEDGDDDEEAGSTSQGEGEKRGGDDSPLSPPVLPFVPSAHLSGRPAPIADGRAAGSPLRAALQLQLQLQLQLAILVLAAPPRHAKAEKTLGLPPPKIRTSAASGENSYIHFRASTFCSRGAPVG